jgi:hypothetical protein
MNAAATNIAMLAERQRPVRLPYLRVNPSLINPPSDEQIAIAANGSMAYPARNIQLGGKVFF